MSSRFYIALYTVAGCLTLVGLSEAIYLTVTNLTGETVLCGGSSDCFKVLGSPYSRIAGVPLATFGAFASLCAGFSAPCVLPVLFIFRRSDFHSYRCRDPDSHRPTQRPGCD
jgi:uncharacterized membrane protein